MTDKKADADLIKQLRAQVKLAEAALAIRDVRRESLYWRTFVLGADPREGDESIFTYRDGIERAANEVQIVCDRLDKTLMGEELAMWLRKLPDDPAKPHPGADTPGPRCGRAPQSRREP